MPAHSKFSRTTIFAAIDILVNCSDTVDFGRMYAEFGLTIAVRPVHRKNWASSLARLLLTDPGSRTADGSDLTEAVISRAVETIGSSGLAEIYGNESAKLCESLKQDGYVVENGQLVRSLAVPLNFTAIDDEVHAGLERFGFLIAEGHLDQAAKNHRDGHWAAANSQLRAAFVSLLDEAAQRLDPVRAADAKTEENRRQLLSTVNPPLLLTGLNEWSADGKNFINGVIKRLHPQGAHPGLSDEEDCTFRFHLVLLVSRLLLRRLK